MYFFPVANTLPNFVQELGYTLYNPHREDEYFVNSA